MGDHEFLVVVNDEEQHSIWRSDRSVPDGWRESGFRGSEDECLEHIESVWADIRPLSLRGRLPGSTQTAQT